VTEDDDPPGWEPADPWGAARSEEALFRRDLDAEQRAERIARAALERRRDIMAGRRAAEALWASICESLRAPRSAPRP
jgi:hypothetical protein